MKKMIIASSVVLALVIIVAFICPIFIKKDNVIEENYQHNMYSDVDSSIGTKEIPDDGIVDESFKTHLPLVVIDMGGQELPNVYAFTEDGMGREYTEEGQENPDPYISMNMKIIDNENGVNTITDTADFENNGKIKLRGMTSRSFAKKQYGIKLMDGDAELEVEVLGMSADEDWVLSNSMIDISGIRNYMTMNIGKHLFEYTPDVRFCEVIFKDGDTYTYQGLYLMSEKVKRGNGRVDINAYNDSDDHLNYIVCRDRYDKTKLTLSTWASDNQVCYGYFTLVYPKEEMLTDAEIRTIEDELTQIEKCLYSDDIDEFLEYKNYIDVDSFVDYFIINEFFMNYDAGNNSTYYYKNREGKLAIGPLWDYDNCLDNYSASAADYETTPFVNQPWFEMLIKDPDFEERIVKRYKELRSEVLNTRYIYGFIDDTVDYLGNALYRDNSMWYTSYAEKYLLQELEDADEFLVNRNRESVEGEITRVKDIIRLHGNWLDKNIDVSLSEYADEDVNTARTKGYSWIIVMGIIAFFCMVILVNRKVKGEYR